MRGGAAAAALAAALLQAGCYRSALGRGNLIAPPAAGDSVELTLVLIGDAGLPAPGGEPVLRGLSQQLARDPRRSFVVFLGDDVYPRGMVLDSTAAERRENERILNTQLAPLLEHRVSGVMVPGNHDWAAGTRGGWQAVVALEDYVNGHGRGLVSMLPGHGCPGPAVLDLGQVVRLIVLDTQWWLQPPDQRPQGEGAADCRARSQAEVVDSLRADLAGAGTRRTVVVAHHPVLSGGQHGGYFDWPTYLFPFHPWARQAGLFARQDVTGSEYRALIAGLQTAFSAHPPLVFAAGHEHNLQLLRLPPGGYQVVSGAGIFNHTSPARAIRGTLYANRASGWVNLAFLHDGRVRLSVQLVDAQGTVSEDYSTWLDAPSLSAAPAPAVVP